MRVAFVTSSPYRHLDTDLPLLVAASRERGVDADVTVWDDPTVDWPSYDTVVVRSCWDYVQRRGEFLAWAATVPHLLNQHAVLDWNSDKVYLRDLAVRGVPIIPTQWDVVAGDEIGSPGEWVVKPTISSGSRDTARWSTPAEVFAHSAELVAAGRTSMTQPYVSSVDDEGETAMLYAGGAFSHAIRKGPLLRRGEGVRQDRDSRESITPRSPTPSQHRVAEAALAAAADVLGAIALLYARVDLVTGPDGTPLLIELELVEPSLFLRESPGGAGRLVDAVVRLRRR